jgi:peptide/nickel transport system permease protein
MTVPAGELEVVSGPPTLDMPGLGGDGGGTGAIKARSPWNIAWRRFRRDKAAIVGGLVALLFVLIALFAKPIEHLFNFQPNAIHNNQFQGGLTDPNTGLPIGGLGGISWKHPLGVEAGSGRDILARMIEGSWVSLLVAFGATVLSNAIGVVFGVVAGYYGGWVDTAISRLMDIFLAFPLLLFAIAISASLQGKAFGLTGLPLHIAVLIFVIGFFNWPYMGRIIRGQTLSLREREFVFAARSLGARGPYILFKELLPNLVAPIIVYSTLLIPANILFEAALDFLGVGIAPPQASWGQELAQSITYYQSDPTFMIVPGVTIFIAVMAFNLLGDGLRDSLDPRSTR